MKDMKVLIVEDNEFKLETTVSYLKELGITNISYVKSLNGGLAELSQAEKNGKQYDLLILDMQLPQYEAERGHICLDGGIRILKEVTHRRYNTKVIINTSKHMEKEKYDAYPNVIGYVKYDSCVYQLQDFKVLIDSFVN